MAVKVLALDATVEEQRQIKSELEILHKVCVCVCVCGTAVLIVMVIYICGPLLL